MGLFDWFNDIVTNDDSDDLSANTTSNDNIGTGDFVVNPATGLPMIDGIGSVDTSGNPFGCDHINDDSFLDNDSYLDSSDTFDPFDTCSIDSTDTIFSDMSDDFSSIGFDDNLSTNDIDDW